MQHRTTIATTVRSGFPVLVDATFSTSEPDVGEAPGWQLDDYRVLTGTGHPATFLKLSPREHAELEERVVDLFTCQRGEPW